MNKRLKEYMDGTVREGRHDCPSCGGRNTFSVTKHQGQIKYNCFKDSCTASGSKTVSRTLSEVRQSLTRQTVTEPRPFTVPDHWISGIPTTSMDRYMRKVNMMDAYNNGDVDVRYDPTMKRVVFLIKKETTVIGAVGRALDKHTQPKSYIYSECNTPFVSGSGSTLVIVEDCASACAVTRLPDHVGMALLGTHLMPHHTAVTKDYDKVIVALDRDASRKGLEIRKELKAYHPDVGIWLLQQDIKDMDMKTLEGLIT